MNILVERDTSAPASHRYAAIDTDWFDGAVGYGATEAEAIAALMELMREFEL